MAGAVCDWAGAVMWAGRGRDDQKSLFRLFRFSRSIHSFIPSHPLIESLGKRLKIAAQRQYIICRVFSGWIIDDGIRAT